MSAFTGVWTDPAAIGYPVLAGGVLLGSIVPVVPTGAVVSAAAAVAATTDHLSLPLVIVVAAAAALAGDLVTFGVARLGSAAAVRVIARGQTPEQLQSAAERFARSGGYLVVLGRLVPAGRIPSLLAAATLEYPARKLVPAATAGCVLWALFYALLGVVSGGLFDNPVLASLVAALLVLLVAAAGALWQQWRSRRAGAARSDAARSDAAQGDAARSDAARTDVPGSSSTDGPRA